MYIISKKKDYYDGVVGTVGIDKTVVYERQIVELEKSAEYPQQIVDLYNNDKNDHFYSRDLSSFGLNNEQKRYAGSCAFIVGFCGKLYVGWKFYRELKRPHWDYSYSPKFKVDYCYDINGAADYIKTEIGKGIFIQESLNKIANADVMDVFRQYHAPIFALDCDWSPDNYGGNYRRSFIINPNLKELQFTKVFDAFTAFQEISMFLGGVLGAGEKEIVEIEDKYKIGQHGFDKWSFRKEPTKKKGRG